MKTIYAIVAVACAPFWVHAQCSIQTTTQNASCYGTCDGQATAQMSGGQAPYSYLWQPIFQYTPTVTGLCAGMYAVTGTDALGCSASDTIIISQPGTLNLVYLDSAASCPTCCDGSIHLTAAGGTPPYSYTWAPSGGPGPNSSNLCPGSYTCCVVDAHGCTLCATCPVNFATGISDPSFITDLSLYPSPASDFIRVTQVFGNAVSARLILVNVLGEIIYAKDISASTALDESINLGGFEKGVYSVSVVTASGVSVRRFVKE